MSAKGAGVLPEILRAWDFLPRSSREGVCMGRWLRWSGAGGGGARVAVAESWGFHSSASIWGGNLLWWENWSLHLGLVCTCGFAPPSLLCLRWEASFILSSTSAKQRPGLAKQGCCRWNLQGALWKEKAFFLNCGKIYMIKFTILTILKCAVQWHLLH